MTPLTSIVTMYVGQLVSVRAHAGHSSQEDQLLYLDGLELAYEGLQVSFHPIDLYSDIGDQVVPTATYVHTAGVWVRAI